MVHIPSDVGAIVDYHRKDYPDVQTLLTEAGMYDPRYHSASNLLAIANGRDGSHGLLLAKQGEELLGCVIVGSCGPEVIELRFLTVKSTAPLRATAHRLVEEARSRFVRYGKATLRIVVPPNQEVLRIGLQQLVSGLA